MTPRTHEADGAPTTVASPAWRYYLPAAGAAIASCAVIVAVHAESVRTLVSAHGLLHSAIAAEVTGERSSFGLPENPFFAGERLPYYWFYHYVAGQLADVAGVHPLRAFEWLALIGVSLVWLAGAELGRRLGWRPAAALTIGGLALTGANALGATILLAKVAAGRPVPADDGTYLWGLAHPALGLARWHDPGALYGPLMSFYLNNSSRALALSLVLAVLIALLRYVQEGRRAVWCGLALATAACTAVSPIIGLMTAMAIAVVLAGARVVRQDVPRAWSAAAALLVGAMLPLPTYVHLLSRAGERESSGAVNPLQFLTIGISLFPLAMLALLGLIRLRGDHVFLPILAVAAAGLLAGNLVLVFPGTNESNLFHVAAFLLAIPAAGAIQVMSEWPQWRRRILVAALLPLFLSTPAIVIGSYWRRPAVPLVLDGPDLRMVPADSPLARLYAWTATATPPDAVFVVAPGSARLLPAGNTPAFPALSKRALFFAEQPVYIVEPYRDAERRRRLSSAMAAGATLSPEDRDYLTALGRPLYLLVFGAPPGQRDRLIALHGSPVFQNADIAVFPVR